MSTKNQIDASGLGFGLAATLLWGSYPLWYKPLAELDSYHLLSWRIVFAMMFLLLLIIATGRKQFLVGSWKSVKITNVLIMSVVLALWWLSYIYGVMAGRVLEVAFGYFLSPIMSMLVSRLIFKEKLNKLQSVAILMATMGVILMSIELLNLQSFPWIAITIGFCYSFYGIFKKKVSGDPLIIQFFEISILMPFAIAFLLIAVLRGNGHIFMQSGANDALLIATGLITVLPLWWYSIAAKKLSVIALGFLQFVPPICNFLLAVFVYHETVTEVKIIAFIFIWLGIALFVSNSVLSAKTKLQLIKSE